MAEHLTHRIRRRRLPVKVRSPPPEFVMPCEAADCQQHQALDHLLDGAERVAGEAADLPPDVSGKQEREKER